MGTGLFWGILLVLIGVGIVIRVVFNIHFPLVKFIIAFFFIFIGIKILLGNFTVRDDEGDEHTTIFSESSVLGFDGDAKEYNVIFGSSVIDLRDVDLSAGPKKVKINTIFGETVLKINANTPIRMKADAAFSSAKLPNGNTAAFGTGRYESSNFSADTNYIYVKSDVVFGSFEVRTYK